MDGGGVPDGAGRSFSSLFFRVPFFRASLQQTRVYIPLRSGAPALVCVQLLIAWGVDGAGGATVVLRSGRPRLPSIPHL